MLKMLEVHMSSGVFLKGVGAMSAYREKFKRFKARRLTTWAIAVISFAAGSLASGRFTHVNQVRADTDRLFELRVYHTVPGKLPALESRFRDTTSKLLAKHDLKVVGYWVSESDRPGEDAFIFLVAHSSREEATKNWDAMRADPAFQEVLKSEQAVKLTEKVDSIYMHPTDFSPMK